MTKFLKTSALIAFLLSSFYTIAEDSFAKSAWIASSVNSVKKSLVKDPVQGEIQRANLCKLLAEGNDIKTKETKELCNK